jgi:hypothetical protein
MWCVGIAKRFPPSNFLHFQNNWSKALYGVAKFILHVGPKAIDVIRTIEKNSPTMPVSFGKVLEGINVPEDLHTLADEILKSEGKPTVGTFQATSRQIARNRYWQWVLMHPKLLNTHIPPSRGVPSLPRGPQTNFVGITTPIPVSPRSHRVGDWPH